MNAFWGGILKYIAQIFAGIIVQMTPVLLDELKEVLINLYKKALATPNPWDDFGIGLLLDIFGIPKPPIE